MHIIMRKKKGGGKVKGLIERVKYVVSGEQGASNVEIIVWISVVLVIASTLFLFRDKIIGFLQKAMNRVDSFEVE